MALTGLFAAFGWMAWPVLAPERALAFAGDVAPVRAASSRFGFCAAGGGADCVVDGDTFRMAGARIRIADIDTPETHPARCPREAELGAAATRRLHALLNAGAVSLAPVERDADRYGRKLRRVAIDGREVGETLVREGLARRYAGGRRAGWCG
jgi:micrococcal nuclease